MNFAAALNAYLLSIVIFFSCNGSCQEVTTISPTFSPARLMPTPQPVHNFNTLSPTETPTQTPSKSPSVTLKKSSGKSEKSDGENYKVLIAITVVGALIIVACAALLYYWKVYTPTRSWLGGCHKPLLSSLLMENRVHCGIQYSIGKFPLLMHAASDRLLRLQQSLYLLPPCLATICKPRLT